MTIEGRPNGVQSRGVDSAAAFIQRAIDEATEELRKRIEELEAPGKLLADLEAETTAAHPKPKPPAEWTPAVRNYMQRDAAAEGITYQEYLERRCYQMEADRNERAHALEMERLAAGRVATMYVRSDLHAQELNRELAEARREIERLKKGGER